MIEDMHACIFAFAFFLCDADELVDGFFTEEFMRAERDQVIEGNDFSSEQFVKEAEHLRDGSGACPVWNDDEHTLAVKLRARQGLRCARSYLRFGQKSIFVTKAFDHLLSHRRLI